MSVFDQQWFRRFVAPTAVVAAVVVGTAGGCKPIAKKTPASTTTTTATTQASAAPATTTSSPSFTVSPTYVVQAGDTLGVIANRVGVSAKSLADANGIDDPNKIAVGQKIRLPTATTTTAKP